ncbi:unnamed protein product, partial [Amoebophrya sp. A120]
LCVSADRTTAKWIANHCGRMQQFACSYTPICQPGSKLVDGECFFLAKTSPLIPNAVQHDRVQPHVADLRCDEIVPTAKLAKIVTEEQDFAVSELLQEQSVTSASIGFKYNDEVDRL